MNNDSETTASPASPANPWAIMCCGKNIELAVELVSEAKELAANGEAEPFACMVRDDKFPNGIEYMIGMVVGQQPYPQAKSGWPPGWDFLPMEDEIPTEDKMHQPSYLKLKNDPDYVFKKVVICLSDVENCGSTLIEIAVPNNMRDGFESYVFDLMTSVLDHIRELASYGLAPALVIKLVITPIELTQRANAKLSTGELRH